MTSPSPKFKPKRLRKSLTSFEILENVDSIWVVGSTVNPNKEITKDSDLDIYIRFRFESELKQFSYDQHTEEVSVQLKNGSEIELPLDVCCVLFPDEKPRSARNRPVYKLF